MDICAHPKNVQDAMLGTQRNITTFWTTRTRFRIPRHYYPIWSQLQELLALQYPNLELIEVMPEVDSVFAREKVIDTAIHCKERGRCNKGSLFQLISS